MENVILLSVVIRSNASPRCACSNKKFETRMTASVLKQDPNIRPQNNIAPSKAGKRLVHRLTVVKRHFVAS